MTKSERKARRWQRRNMKGLRRWMNHKVAIFGAGNEAYGLRRIKWVSLEESMAYVDRALNEREPSGATG